MSQVNAHSAQRAVSVISCRCGPSWPLSVVARVERFLTLSVKRDSAGTGSAAPHRHEIMLCGVSYTYPGSDRAAVDRVDLRISHRFSSVRSADRIYVVESGRIVESGCHNDLMASEGRIWSCSNYKSAPTCSQPHSSQPSRFSSCVPVSAANGGPHGTTAVYTGTRSTKSASRWN